MVPTSLQRPHTSRLVYTLFSLVSAYVKPSIQRLFNPRDDPSPSSGILLRRTTSFDPHQTKDIVFAALIPVLVLLSGVFAGLTLGYMSLDETQLNVLSISGTPKQREYANKIKPIRKNGHLLLVTLLLANMIVNESLPVISDPVLGGGVQSVVVSTVLIVIFAEIIPQSVFTRHGLYLGAKLAGCTKVLIYILGIVSYPVAKLLEFVLGSHHGIIYRRAELKELIAMHSHGASHGGDLKNDTVTIIGATLDLQEKVVRQAMTPISDVFMLSLDAKLDYELLKKICLTGHSRVPVYEEVDVPVMQSSDSGAKNPGERMVKVKKIVGILLVKQCVLLDPKDAVPLRKIPLNKVPFVPNNEPLLGILDKFQEGRSHMAIVSRFSVDKATSVKIAVKRGLTQRLKERVGMGDSSDEEELSPQTTEKNEESGETDMDTLKGDGVVEKDFASTRGSGTHRGRKRRMRVGDLEMGIEETLVEGDTIAVPQEAKDGPSAAKEAEKEAESKIRRPSFHLPVPSPSGWGLEQSMPADAVLAKEAAAEFLQSFDPAVMPLGIITLEDVLEELIGEEIYDEFDEQGAHGDPYVPPAAILHEPVAEPPPKPSGKFKAVSPSMKAAVSNFTGGSRSGAPAVSTDEPKAVVPVSKSASNTPALKPMTLKGLRFFRSRSAPPRPRGAPASPESAPAGAGGDEPAAPVVPDAIAVPEVEQRPRPPARTNSQPIITSDLSINDNPEHSVIVPDITVDKSPSSPTNPEGDGANIGPRDRNGNVKLKSLPSSSVGHGLAPLTPITPLPQSSRGELPAPPLEAILLDRKRRLGAATTGSVSSLALTPGGERANALGGTSANKGSATPGGKAVGAKPTMPGVNKSPMLSVTGPGVPKINAGAASGKGMRFKSSPLGIVDRSGVLVAEHVKQEIITGSGVGEDVGIVEQVAERSNDEDEMRIPEAREKEGPDI